MIDQMRDAYSQMQPGDKMVMQLHKSQKPANPQYEMPQDQPAAPPMPVQTPPMLTGGGAGLPRDAGMPGDGLTALGGGVGAGTADPMARRQALMAALAARIGGRV